MRLSLRANGPENCLGCCARVFDLAHFLELVVDRFDQQTLKQQDLILHVHEFIGHVFPDICDCFQTACIELIEEIFADVAFVAEKLDCDIFVSLFGQTAGHQRCRAWV